MPYGMKPGYMHRAVVAFLIFETIFLAVFLAVAYMFRDNLTAWYIGIPIIFGVIIGQFAILGETIGSAVKHWIEQYGEH